MFILFFLLSFSSAFADVMNLNENMPTRMEDASVTPVRKIDLQGSIRYDDHDPTLTLFPNVRWGVVKRMQLEYAGDANRAQNKRGHGKTNHHIGFQWNFNDQDDWVPSLAISPQLIYPTTGANSKVYDQAVKFILTYTLLGTLADPAGQFHLNYRYTNNKDKQEGEVSMGKQMIFGYSHKLNDYSSLVLDYVNQQEPDARQTRNDLELGWMHEMRKNLYLGMGVAMDVQLGHFSSNLSGQFTF